MQTTSNGRRGTLITFLALMFGVLTPFLVMIAPYSLALLMGGILAVLSHPVFLRLRARRFSPRLASAIVTAGLLVLVLGPLTLLVIAAVRQTIAVASSLSNRDVLSFSGLTGWLLKWGPVQEMLGSAEEVQSQIRSTASGVIQSASSLVLSFAAQIPELLLQMVLALFAAFFFLVDGPVFLDWVLEKIPISRNVRAVLLTSFRNTTVSVILASVAAAGVQATLMLLGFLVLSVPAPFLAGGATFIFAWIPMLGSFPVWAAGAVYLYFQGSLVKMVLLIILGVITSVVDNVVRPMVLRGRSEMHPMVSLVAIFGGIAMFGILGVFVGPILTAMVIAVLNTWPTVAAQYGVSVGTDVEDIHGLGAPQAPPPPDGHPAG